LQLRLIVHLLHVSYGHIEMLPDALMMKYGAHHPSTLYSATEREGDPWDPSTLVAPESGTVGPYVKTKNTICFYLFIYFCYEKVAFLWVNNKEEDDDSVLQKGIKRGILNTNEGILVLIRSKNACAAHMFEFPLAETENANGMAKLKIFVTSLGSIATFFQFGA